MPRIDIEEKMQGFVVYNANGQTNPASQGHARWVTPLEACAHRLVSQNSRHTYEPATLFKIKGRWYGPVNLITNQQADIDKQKLWDKHKEAMERAKEAGLDDETIRMIRINPKS